MFEGSQLALFEQPRECVYFGHKVLRPRVVPATLGGRGRVSNPLRNRTPDAGFVYGYGPAELRRLFRAILPLELWSAELVLVNGFGEENLRP